MEPVDRTFVIADIRGYTRFTREHGDEAAARLAVAFAELARDAVEARGGSVVELRGDEALCVFEDSADAVRAALELQLLCAEELATRPDLPLRVGIGIDAGEAVPVEDGYRGSPLNLAARLCSNAGAGQVLASPTVAARLTTAADLDVQTRGQATLKGFEDDMSLLEVGFVHAVAALPHVSSSQPIKPADPALTTQTPLAGRVHEMRRLRGTWRVVRRGRGGVVALRGRSGIGKTRLAAELAALVAEHGGRVDYVGLGGSATAQLRRDLAEVEASPRLLVVDDLDAMGPAAVAALTAALPDIETSPTLVLVTLGDEEDDPALEALLDAAGRALRLVTVGPLDADAVRELTADYVDLAHADVPVDAFTRDSEGVPARVHEVVASWTRAEAERRLAAAAQWNDQRSADLAFANDVIGRGLKRLYAGGEVAGDDACPYLGLAAFDGDDAGRFFGREILVGELAARSVGAGLLCVVGPSGAGKSSVVAAGLVPSLAAGLLPGSEHWDAVAMRPGEHPLLEWVALPARSPGSTRRVVVVDQLEELFTLCTDADERAGFVNELVQQAADPEGNLVVLAVRGDHYASTAAYPDLAELIAANTVLVGPMSRDELRRAIELPARRAGRHVELALVDALVHDSLDQPGALPLLSTALVELWQDSADGWLRRATYEEQGGLSGAVARLAERSYAELTPPQQEAARSILLRLVTGDDEQASRRPVPLADFDVDRDPVAGVVLGRLTDDRLLTQDGTHVEVAHEALIREWPRLRDWLEEDTEGRQLRAHLARSSAQWEASGRSPDELFRGARLAAALDWSTSHGRDLNERERAFVQASRAASESDAASQRRTNRRLRGLLVGTTTVLVVALVAGALAAVQRSSAVRNEKRAQDQTLVADAQRLGALSGVEQQPDLALLLAAQGHHLDPSTDTYGNLVQSMLRYPRMVSISRPTGQRLVRVAAPPSGATYAVADSAGQVLIMDSTTGDPLYPALSLPYTREMTYSSDGWTLYLLGWPHRTGDHEPPTLRAVNVATGTLRWQRTVPADEEPSLPTLGGTGSGTLRAAPGSNDVVWASYPTMYRYEPDSGRLVARYPMGDSAEQLLLPDNRMLELPYTDGDRRPVRIVDVRTGRVISSWQARAPIGEQIALSPDGRYVALAGWDGTSQHLIGVLDLQEKTSHIMHGQALGQIPSMTFSPDGTVLLSTDDTGAVDEWGVQTGDHRDHLEGHSAFLRGAVYVDRGRRLVTVGLDGRLITWDASNVNAFAVRQPRPGPACTTGECAFAWMGLVPGRNRLALIELPVPGGFGIQFVDAATLRPIGAMPGRVRTCCQQPAFSPDGALLAALDPLVARVLLYDVTSGQALRRLLTTDEESTSVWGAKVIDTVSYASNGRWVAANINEDVVVLDPSAAGRVATLHSPGFLEWVSFSPDSRYVVGCSEDGSVTVWRTSDWKVQWQRHIEDASTAPATYSPDGRILAVGSESGQIHVLDPRTGIDLRPPLLAHTSWVASLSFSPDGAVLASSGIDGHTYLWDTATGRQMGQPFPTIGSATSMFAPNGSLYVNTLDDVYRLDVTPEGLLGAACRIAGRTLTDAEWQRYLPDRPRDDACGSTPVPG